MASRTPVFAFLVLFMSFHNESEGTVHTSCSKNISSWEGTFGLTITDAISFNGNNSITCVWKITVATGNNIRILIEEFQIQNETNCCVNYLEISEHVPLNDSLLTKKLVRVNSSFVYVSRFSQLSVRMVIINMAMFKTFMASYQGICSTVVNDGSAGVISSPNYPRPFPSFQKCSWKIRSRGSGYKTRIDVKYLKLNPNCQQNVLNFTGSRKSIRICNVQDKSSTFHFDGEIVINFVSKNNDGNFSGFYIEYTEQDIDECAISHQCHQKADCINTEGSFYCNCRPFFTGNGSYCEDIDECAMGKCSKNADCTNIEGGYDCKCKQGFTGNGHILCYNKNECNDGEHNCDVNAECIDTKGSFKCECKKSYIGNGTYCKDIDECSLEVCDKYASCFNTNGGYSCSCNKGFIGNGLICTDVDECFLNSSICIHNAKCQNTLGSYHCCCQIGFTGDGLNCTDIDECKLNTHSCHSMAKCFNTHGSFICNCALGYTGDGINCIDIDECSLNASNCHQNAKCLNFDGFYNCSCDPGFIGNGVNCTDEDECSSNRRNCHSNANCTNLDGSYKCNCNLGFIGNGFNCTDVNECSSNQDNCHPNAKCENLNGSYNCNCDLGFIGDGFNCTDTSTSGKTSNLDECSLRQNHCDPKAKCYNIFGSYRCECDVGYTGDGFNCTGMIKMCPFEIKEDVAWDNTPAGIIIINSCPHGHEGNCSRSCTTEAVWEDPDLNNCVSREIANLFRQLKGRTVPKETILNGTLSLSNITDPSNPTLYSGDFIAVVDLLQHIVADSNKSRLSNFDGAEIRNLSYSYSKTVNNLLDGQNLYIWKRIRKRENIVLTMITHVETFGHFSTERQIELDERQNTQSANYNYNLNNIEVTSHIVKLHNFNGFTFGTNTNQEKDYYGRIIYPKNVFRKVHNKDHYAGIFTAIYQNVANILVFNKESIRQKQKGDGINSVIITANVNIKKLNFLGDLVDPIEITFQHIKKATNKEPQCVFLNTNNGENLNYSNRTWLRSGCSVYSSNLSHTVCHCFHLTNFALLLDINKIQTMISKEHNLALTIISYVACSISMVSACVAIIIFKYLRLRSDRISVHKHLAINICLTQLMFLISSESFSISWVCICTAVLLHFFLLSMFSWMLIEGIHMYKSLVQVFSSRSTTHFKKYWLLGYGIPVIIVSIAVWLFWEDYGTSSMCWISYNAMLSTLVPPLAVVIMINAVILGLVIRVLLCPSNIRIRERTIVEEIKCSLRASITLLPLLGICWIFGFLQISNDTLFFSYIFVIMNASQGLCFLIFHCLLSNEVKVAWNKSTSSSDKKRNEMFYNPRSLILAASRTPTQPSLGNDAFEVSSSPPMNTSDQCMSGNDLQASKMFGIKGFDGDILLKELNVSSVKLKQVKLLTTDNLNKIEDFHNNGKLEYH